MADTVLAFSRELAKEIGVPAALLYQELQRKYHYWKSQGKLNEEEMFWCDQGEIAEWILVHPNTVSKAAKELEDAGLIKKKVSYRPGTVTPTTWWGLLISEFTPNVNTRNHTKCENYIKANTESNTGIGGKNELNSVSIFPKLFSKFKRAGIEVVNKKQAKEKLESLLAMFREEDTDISLEKILEAADNYIDGTWDSKSLQHFLSPNVFPYCLKNTPNHSEGEVNLWQ